MSLYLLLSALPAFAAAPPAAATLSPAEVERLRAREVFETLVEAGHPVSVREGAPPPARNGSNKLDVYRAGELALAVDDDGEWLADASTHIMGGDLNWVLDSISGAFYKHFDDEYDYMCVMLVNDLGFFGAFYSPLANDVRGIGYDSIIRSEVFDQSSNNLQGFIFMNAAELWWENPAAGRFVFGQEFMHRWGSFVNISHEGLGENDLLGRDTAHWSYWLHTTNSPMEGNSWNDLGDGSWRVDYRATSTYSDLDLYLMGFLPPEEVGGQTFLVVSPEEQARVGREAASTPEGFAETYAGMGQAVTVSATPVAFTVDDIIAAEGARDPAAADSPRSFKMAMVILVLSSDVIDPDTLSAIDGVRTTFESDWEADVRGLADLDTTLGGGDAPEWGAEPGDTGDTDTGGVVDDDTDTADSAGDDTSADDTGEDDKSGCACATGPGAAPVALGAALLGAALLGRRRRD